MAKKAVVYTPPTSIAVGSNLIDKEIQQIPPYEDAGVQFRSKYKVQKGQNTWELKNQSFRYYFEQGAQGSSGFIARPNYKEAVFYLKQIIVDWHLAGARSDYIRLFDGYYLIGGLVKQFEFRISQGTTQLVIDLPVPIKFSQNNIGYDIWSGAGVGDWLDFTLVGWDELI
jgi:hypothetical protein